LNGDFYVDFILNGDIKMSLFLNGDFYVDFILNGDCYYTTCVSDYIIKVKTL
jgi:hypothetical protein